jgi:membrane protein implicated in regulation of membrane protease activity
VLLVVGILLAIFVLPWPWGLAAAVGGGILDITESVLLLRWSRRRRSAVGPDALVGKRGVVVSPTQIRVQGELWQARSADPLVLGEEVEVTAVDGLTLEVRPPSRAPR